MSEGMNMEQPTPSPTVSVASSLKRTHAKRLREVYRSSGWPSQDIVELELLAAGLLERLTSPTGHELVRVTGAGVQFLAGSAQSNRSAFSKHEQLVDQVALSMQRDGRIVWKGLSLRAQVPPAQEGETGHWKTCMPDVFSIRNTTVQAYLEPIVHEIKVSRADLLGDLKVEEKRLAYLDIGGQCWYVLGQDAKGRPIGDPSEVPLECGVLMSAEGKLDVARMAPKRPTPELPFAVWMALAKAVPVISSEEQEDLQVRF
jgi:hypothetical protein